jgi:PTH1 family peptidyl-tRNA hydrolase
MDKATPSIKAVIGLGNPSAEYQKTYHNVGRIFVDYHHSLFKDEAVTSFINPPRKNFEYCQLSNKLLIKTLTFMNNSGSVVKQALAYLKLKPEQIAVVHDDSDMIVGNYKISFDQSSAGHKGVQSIIDALKTQKFWRIKIGIRPAKEGVRQKSEEFVLKRISKRDESDLALVFGQIISEIKNKA